MQILHRHIFRSVGTTCLASAALFVFVLIVGNALRDLLGYALSGQIEPLVFAKLLLLLVPYVAAYALPIGMLTGVLLVLGRMSGNSEITAIRAAGLGLGYVARPVWMVAAAGVLLSLALNFYYMPLARSAYKATLVDAVRSNPLNFLVPRTFVRDFPGVVVYAGERSGAELKDFWVWQFDDQKRVTRFAHARTGRIDFVEADNKLVVTLRDVSVETRDKTDPEDFSSPEPIAFTDELAVDLKLDNVFGKKDFRAKLHWMTLGQLLSMRQELAADTQKAPDRLRLERMKLNMVINEKASSSLAVLAFAILGLPLGIKVSRKETSANLGVAVALILIYYFLAGIGGWLESYPVLRPDLLVWLPSLIFCGLGVWLFRKLGRN